MKTSTSSPIPETAALTLVLGGTGKTGHRVAQRLEERGRPFRLGSRACSPTFDWAEPGTWDPALDGVDAVYLSYAPDLAVPGAPGTIEAFVRRARSRGVRRVVLLSGRGEPVARHCEEIVERSGLSWTVIRASWFDQNFSEGAFVDMVLSGVVALPAGDVREPFVDVDDIADVAVAALVEDGHDGEIYEVTGPDALTFAEAVAEIASASHRDILYQQIPHADFTAGIARAGAPGDIAWLLDYLFSSVLDGRNSRACNGVQRALGREPKSFRDYARRTAAAGVWTDASAVRAA
jgi:uncharacterized protein YbjT (DUF2867 family)